MALTKGKIIGIIIIILIVISVVVIWNMTSDTTVKAVTILTSDAYPENGETGIEIESLFQFKAFDAINRDPRHRTISVIFYSFIDQIKNVTGMDDAAEAKWFPLKELPSLAFDHSEIIEEFFANKKLTW